MQKIIIGESALSEKLTDMLVTLLCQDAEVLIATHSYIDKTSGKPGVLILSAYEDTIVRDENAILLLPRDSALPIVEAPLALVCDSARGDWPQAFDGEFISCGHSAKDTLTLSSFTEDSAVVALMRQIESLSGQVIEPCEFPIVLKYDDPFFAFAAVSVLMLTDRLELLGEISPKGNNLQL